MYAPPVMAYGYGYNGFAVGVRPGGYAYGYRGYVRGPVVSPYGYRGYAPGVRSYGYGYAWPAGRGHDARRSWRPSHDGDARRRGLRTAVRGQRVREILLRTAGTELPVRWFGFRPFVLFLLREG